MKLMKLIKIHLFIASFAAFGVLKVFAASPTAERKYLSFEEKVLANYALLAYKKDDAEKSRIFKRALAYGAQVAAVGTKTVNVENFEDFLAHFRGEWPNSGDLNLDLQRLESLPKRGLVSYRSSSPRVQNQLDRFLTKHKEFLLSTALGGVMEISSDRRWAHLGEEFIGQQMEAFNSIGEKISAAGLAAIKDPTSRIVLQTLFNEYYSRQALDSKKQMIAAILDVDLHLNDEAKLEIMLQNSGPQFQKLLQVVARQAGLPSELRQTFKRLESAVKPVPWWQVEQILSEESKNYEFTYFERRPLGVGTMAQVHRAKIQLAGNRKDVVARFLKPGIENRVNDDHRILTEVANVIDQNAEYRASGGPLMAPLISDITDTVRAELDQDATIKRQIQAKKVYDTETVLVTPGYKNTLRFHVPAIFPAKGPSQLMLQEMVIGKSLDKEAKFYHDSIPFLKKGIVEAMAEVWAREMLFGTGFYHADLHQGNFLVNMTDDAITVNILDFGMGGVLSEKMRQQVMVLGAATALKDAQIMANAYWDISDKGENKIGKEVLLYRIQNKLSELSRKSEKIELDRWVGWASDQGLKIPYELVNLSRGMLIVNNSLLEAGSTKTISSIEKDFAKRHPLKSYTSLTENGIFSAKKVFNVGVATVVGKVSPRSKKLFPTISCQALF